MVTTWKTRLAYSLTQRGRLEQALEVLQQIDHEAPALQFAEASYLRGQTLRKLERMNDAAAAFRQARDADPNGTWAAPCQESLDEMAPYLDQVEARPEADQLVQEAQPEVQPPPIGDSLPEAPLAAAPDPAPPASCRHERPNCMHQPSWPWTAVT